MTSLQTRVLSCSQPAAVEFHEQCLQHAITLCDDSMISSSLCNLGNAHNQVWSTTLIQIRARVCIHHRNTHVIEWNSQIGNYQKAFEYIERSILLARDKGDKAVEARGTCQSIGSSDSIFPWVRENTTRGERGLLLCWLKAEDDSQCLGIICTVGLTDFKGDLHLHIRAICRILER